MSKAKRWPAFVAYLVPVLGWLYALIFHKANKFVTHHARQSIMLTFIVIVAPLAWAIFAWLVTWIPTGGSLLAVASFALVILAYIIVVILWIMGMVRALRAMQKPLPVVGEWAQRIPVGERDTD